MDARHLSVAILVLCTAGCAPSFKPMTATAGPSTTGDFSNYATFFVMKGNSSGDPVADDRIISLVETTLTEKGWLEVPEGDGQAAVVVHTATPTNHTYESFYNGWGGWQWRSAPSGSAPGFVEDYKVGTVVVTIFDAETKHPIWRGFAADSLSGSPRHDAKATEEAVAKMFSTLPPPTIPGGLEQSRQPGDGDLGVARSAATTGAGPVKTNPPTIILSTVPAIIVRIDGDPVFRPVPGTELQRIVNTKPLIVRDVIGTYYLKVLDGWMEAYSLDGVSWSVSGVAPTGSSLALQQAVASKTVDLLDGVDPKNPAGARSLTDEPAPNIFISKASAELIVTEGPMVFAPIEGTSLEYVANTTADLFREPTDQELYLLIAGQWFRSWKADGPWQSVPGGELPADFARIPDASPKARVKASIAASK